MDAQPPPSCSGGRSEAFEGSVGLRIGAIFILLASSSLTTFFPILTKRVPRCQVPASMYDWAKYFGAGVIIATAFIHLLAPGTESLTSECVGETFHNYPFSFAFALISMYMTFVVELLAFRIGRAKAQSLAYDPHVGGHHHASEHVTSSSLSTNNNTSGAPPASDGRRLGTGASDEEQQKHPLADHKKDVGAGADTAGRLGRDDDLELRRANSATRAPVAELAKGVVVTKPLDAAASEILGVMILEFGVIFHSVIIGLTLGTTNDFTVLFIVIIFHQMFEGLGLGTRLAQLPLRPNSLLPYVGALAYSAVTPIGLAIGLGVRNTYNADSAEASYITGTFDSVSAGVLLYTGLVELLAHEFVFNERMRNAPGRKVALHVSQVALGAALMALLGRWA